MGAKTDTRFYRRQDVLVLFGGLVFIGALIGVIYAIGAARGWHAPNGFSYNTSVTCQERFLPEPEPIEWEPYPDIRGRNRPTAAAHWYYWKLRPELITAGKKAFVWCCYFAHQLTIWFVLYMGQLAKTTRTKEDGPKYSTDLNKYGWICVGLNVFFHLLHLLQTHTTYDATAPDVAIASSQASVITLMICVMVMEYNERGLLLGWPTVTNKDRVSSFLRLNFKPVHLMRKYHGYAFAWASIYTFWYHPMENTYGHALGFFHTWIIMLQGSLMYTKIHLNPYWRFVLESWVLIHGSLVAAQTGQGTSLWPMFFFGFLLMLSLTWLFILPFWKRLPWWTRIFPFIIWLAVVIGNYSWIKDSQGMTWTRITEVVRMPLVFYPGFLILWLVAYVTDWIDMKIWGNRKTDPTPLQRALYILGCLFCFAVMITISILMELMDVQMPLIAMMIVLVMVFSSIVGVMVVLMKHIFPKPSFLQEAHSDEDIIQEDSPSSSKTSIAPEPEDDAKINGQLPADYQKKGAPETEYVKKQDNSKTVTDNAAYEENYKF